MTLWSRSQNPFARKVGIACLARVMMLTHLDIQRVSDTRMTWFVLFLGLLLGGPQGKAAPQTYTLDFVGGTTAAAQQGSKAQIVRPPRVAPGSAGEPLPFELTLVSLDRNG